MRCTGVLALESHDSRGRVLSHHYTWTSQVSFAIVSTMIRDSWLPLLILEMIHGLLQLDWRVRKVYDCCVSHCHHCPMKVVAWNTASKILCVILVKRVKVFTEIDSLPMEGTEDGRAHDNWGVEGAYDDYDDDIPKPQAPKHRIMREMMCTPCPKLVIVHSHWQRVVKSSCLMTLFGAWSSLCHCQSSASQTYPRPTLMCA